MKEVGYVKNNELTTQDEEQNRELSINERHLLDKATGEEFIVDNFAKRIYGVKNFWKCYLMDFLSVLGIVDNRQVDVFIYIAENTSPYDNTFVGTYRKIATDLGCSTTTVNKIMKKLQEHQFVKKLQNGAWLVNPKILMRGNERKRQIMLSYFLTDEPINAITHSRTKKTENEE